MNQQGEVKVKNAYDEDGRLLTTTDGFGNSYTFSYDVNGSTTCYIYNARNQVESVTDAPEMVNNAAGKEQLNRYVQAGIILNPMINMTMLPSMRHSDKLIKYYTYPQDSGMIYWSYVKKPQVETAPVRVKEREIDWATVAMYAVGSVIIVGGVAYLACTGAPL